MNMFEKDQKLKIQGSFENVLKVSIKDNLKPKKKKQDKK